MGGGESTSIGLNPPVIYLPVAGTETALLIAPSDVLTTSEEPDLLDKSQVRDLTHQPRYVTVPFPKQEVHPFQAAILLRDVRAFIDALLRSSPETQIGIAASHTSLADISEHLALLISARLLASLVPMFAGIEVSVLVIKGAAEFLRPDGNILVDASDVIRAPETPRYYPLRLGHRLAHGLEIDLRNEEDSGEGAADRPRGHWVHDASGGSTWEADGYHAASRPTGTPPSSGTAPDVNHAAAARAFDEIAQELFPSREKKQDQAAALFGAALARLAAHEFRREDRPEGVIPSDANINAAFNAVVREHWTDRGYDKPAEAELLRARFRGWVRENAERIHLHGLRSSTRSGDRRPMAPLPDPAVIAGRVIEVRGLIAEMEEYARAFAGLENPIDPLLGEARREIATLALFGGSEEDIALHLASDNARLAAIGHTNRISALRDEARSIAHHARADRDAHGAVEGHFVRLQEALDQWLAAHHDALPLNRRELETALRYYIDFWLHHFAESSPPRLTYVPEAVEDAIAVMRRAHPAVAGLPRHAGGLIAAMVRADVEAARSVRVDVGEVPVRGRRVLRSADELRGILGNALYAAFQGLRETYDEATYNFAFHYFRLALIRHGDGLLERLREVEADLVAEIYQYIDRARERFPQRVLDNFQLFFMAYFGGEATLEVPAPERRRGEVHTLPHLLLFDDSPRAQEGGMANLLAGLPGIDSDFRRGFQRDVGISYDAFAHWGSIHRLPTDRDAISDQAFREIQEAARRRGVPAAKNDVTPAQWDAYIAHLRDTNRLERESVEPARSSLELVMRAYHFVNAHARGYGLAIDFFDFISAIYPVIRRLRARATEEGDLRVVHVAVPEFMRRLPFEYWGYATWAQLVLLSQLARDVLDETARHHALGETESPLFRTIEGYTTPLSEEGDDSLYDFAAGLLRAAFLLDFIDVRDETGDRVTQADPRSTPSRYRVVLVSDASELPTGHAPLDGSRRRIIDKARRRVYRDRLTFADTYLRSIALLPEDIHLTDSQGRAVTLADLRRRCNEYIARDRDNALLLDDRGSLAATRSQAEIDRIVAFYREASAFVEEVVFLTLARGEVGILQGSLGFVAIPHVGGHDIAYATDSGDLSIVIDDIPAAATEGDWEPERIRALVTLRVLARFSSIFGDPSHQLNTDVLIEHFRPNWQGTETELETAVNDYIRLERARGSPPELRDHIAPRGRQRRGTPRQHLGPIPPPRRSGADWRNQFLGFVQADARGSNQLSEASAAAALAALERYFATTPTHLGSFWPARLREMIAAEVPDTDRTNVYNDIVAFLPTIGMTVEVNQRPPLPTENRAAEEKIAEWALADYLELFPTNGELEARAVPENRRLLAALVDLLLSQHAQERRGLRRGAIRDRALEALRRYNRDLPLANEVAGNGLPLATQGLVDVRLAEAEDVWNAAHPKHLDHERLVRAHALLSPPYFRLETVDAAVVARALGVEDEMAEEAQFLTQLFIDQQADLRALREMVLDREQGIVPFVRQRFRARYITDEGLHELALAHGHSVLSSRRHAIDLHGLARDVVGDTFGAYEDIADRMAQGYEVIYRRYLNERLTEHQRRIDDVHAAIEAVRGEVVAGTRQPTGNRTEFDTAVFARCRIRDRAELELLVRRARLLHDLTATDRGRDVREELTVVFDQTIAPLHELRLRRIGEIQAEAEPLIARIAGFAARVAETSAEYMAIPALVADADRASAERAAENARTGLKILTGLRGEYGERERDGDHLLVLASEMEGLRDSLAGEVAQAAEQLAQADGQITAAQTKLTALRDTAVRRLAAIIETEAAAAQAIAEVRAAAERAEGNRQTVAAVARELIVLAGQVEVELRSRAVLTAGLEDRYHAAKDAIGALVSQEGVTREVFVAAAGRYNDFAQETRRQLEHFSPQAGELTQRLEELTLRVQAARGALSTDQQSGALHSIAGIEQLLASLRALPTRDVFEARTDRQGSELWAHMEAAEQKLVPGMGAVFRFESIQPLPPTDEVTWTKEDIEVTVTFRQASVPDSNRRARQALKDILEGQVMTNGAVSVFLSSPQAIRASTWLSNRVVPLRGRHLFDGEMSFEAHAAPVRLLQRSALPADHRFVRMLDILDLLLTQPSNEVHLVLELQRHRDHNLLHALLQHFAGEESHIATADDAQRLVRRFALAYREEIIGTLGGHNRRRIQQVNDRYFHYERRSLKESKPTPMDPLARIASEQGLPRDLADLLPAGLESDAEIEAAIDALGILPEGKEYDAMAEEWRREVREGNAEAAKELLDAGEDRAVVERASTEEEVALAKLSPVEMKAMLVINIVGLGARLSENRDFSLFSCTPSYLYRFILTHREAALARVAAHRAENPSGPHPEMLPLGDWERLNSMALDEITERLEAVGIPLPDAAVEDYETAVRLLYYHALLHRSRIIAEVLHREQERVAELGEVALTRPTATVPAAWDFLLPVEGVRTDGDRERELDALGFWPGEGTIHYLRNSAIRTAQEVGDHAAEQLLQDSPDALFVVGELIRVLSEINPQLGAEFDSLSLPPNIAAAYHFLHTEREGVLAALFTWKQRIIFGEWISPAAEEKADAVRINAEKLIRRLRRLPPRFHALFDPLRTDLERALTLEGEIMVQAAQGAEADGSIVARGDQWVQLDKVLNDDRPRTNLTTAISDYALQRTGEVMGFFEERFKFYQTKLVEIPLDRLVETFEALYTKIGLLHRLLSSEKTDQGEVLAMNIGQAMRQLDMFSLSFAARTFLKRKTGSAISPPQIAQTILPLQMFAMFLTLLEALGRFSPGDLDVFLERR